MRTLLKLECEQRREFEALEREMRYESPETKSAKMFHLSGGEWYDDRFGELAYELGVKHGLALAKARMEELNG